MDEQKTIPGLEKIQAVIAESVPMNTSALIVLKLDEKGQVTRFQFGHQWDVLQMCNMFVFNEMGGMLGFTRNMKPTEETK